jgi:hypothetical protein
MPADVLIWAITVPALIAGVILLLGVAPWRSADDASTEESGQAAPGRWAAGVAIAMGYVVGQWGLVGWQPLGGDITQWLIYLALAAGAVGALEALVPLPRLARWPIRFGLGFASAYLLLRPLVANGSVESIWIAVLAAGIVLVWTVIDLLAAEERGPALALFLALLVGGVAATVLFSGNATTAMLSGALIATLGAVLVLTLKWPALARLRSAAPVVAVVCVGQLAVGRFYTDGMPPLSFLLLLAAPLALLGAHLPLRRRGWVLALLGRLVALGAPVAVAAALAASTYFAPTATSAGAAAPASSKASGTSKSPGKTKAKKAWQDDGYGY